VIDYRAIDYLVDLDPWCSKRRRFGDHPIGLLTRWRELLNQESGKDSKAGLKGKPNSQARKDFFGREIVQSQGKTESKMESRGHVVYVYNQGYSNAVRKPLMMKELLFHV
jgi:hypothetical protein